MKKAMSRLVGSATVTVLMVACTPVAPLSGNSGGDSPRTSAQQTEMAALQMPAYAQAEAAEAEAARAPRDPGGLIRSMVQITDADRTGVRSGLVPASVLTYDTQLIRMMTKTPATLEEHQRDPAWAKRKHALFVARDAALQAHTNAVVQKNQQEEQMYSNTAQIYGSFSDQQRKEESDRAAAHQDYLNRLGAVPDSPDCIVTTTQSWTGCAPR
jgi:hypothetical protein